MPGILEEHREFLAVKTTPEERQAIHSGQGFAWGHIWGIINRYVEQPETALRSFFVNPSAGFGTVMANLMRSKKKLPEKVHQGIAFWMADISGQRGALSLEEQGDFWIGFYQEVDDGNKRRKKEPPKRTDWSQVDWSLSDADLSKEYRVTRQTVNGARKLHAPHTMKKAVAT